MMEWGSQANSFDLRTKFFYGEPDICDVKFIPDNITDGDNSMINMEEFFPNGYSGQMLQENLHPWKRQEMQTPVIIDGDNLTKKEVTDITETKDDNKNYFETKLGQKVEMEEAHFCGVCGKSCRKNNSYGGQVCPSCRAFFRRSVQSNYFKIFSCDQNKCCNIDPDTRKNCKFCRFQKCLQTGMKKSWVLSDEQRIIRFNKFYKMKLSSKTGKVKPVSDIFMKITMEEVKLLNEIRGRFQMTTQEYWHTCLRNIEEEYASNIVESAFGLSTLKNGPWSMMSDLMELFFVRNVIPNFSKICSLSYQEVNYIIDGRGPALANFFKICLYLRMESNPNISDCFGFKDHNECPYRTHMTTLVTQPHTLSKSLELSAFLCQLALEQGHNPNFPTYENIFPTGWAKNGEVENQHRDAVAKIQEWPRNKDNQFDYNLFILMTLVFLFSGERGQTLNRSSIEQNQLKYCLLLQRYLRSSMEQEEANKKYLAAMELISLVEHVMEMNCLKN